MAGLDATGFVPKTQPEVEEEIKEGFREDFGASIDTSAQSAFGQIAGTVSDRIGEVWDQTQAVHAAGDPDSATGSALDSICAITGTFRLAAAASRIQTVVCVGTNGTVLPLGRVASVDDTLARFASIAEVTIAAVGAWAISTAYTLGQRRSNSGNVYEVITAGTSAGSGGPTTTAADITDGSVHWKYLGTGNGAVNAIFDAEETGPVLAVTGTLRTIETPVSGWTAVVNQLDAEPGRNIETDPELRVRRETELRATGKGPLESIRAAMLRVAGVTACTVFQNVTDSVDGDGLPAHSVEVLVRDGFTGTTDNDLITEAVFRNVAAGIRTHGTVTDTYVDSQGVTQTVKWSRPTDLDIWVIINVTKDPNVFPSDGDDQIKAKIVAYGATFTTGKNAVSSTIAAQSVPTLTPDSGVAGVLDITSCLIGLSNPPVASTTIAVSLRQLARFDTARITVNLADGTP